MAKCRIDLQPMVDNVLFRDGVSREDGYRELFALAADCPPREIVDLHFGDHQGLGVVWATWEGEALTTATTTRVIHHG